MCQCNCGTFVDYTGRNVFVEAVRDPDMKSNEYSNYNGGEYFIVRHTPNFLYGVKLHATGVYEMRRIVDLPLVGRNRYAAINSQPCDSTFVREYIDRLWLAAHAPERGEKLQWVASLYDEAKATARQMAKLSGYTLGNVVPVPSEFDARRIDGFDARINDIQKQLSDMRSKLRVL